MMILSILPMCVADVPERTKNPATLTVNVALRSSKIRVGELARLDLMLRNRSEKGAWLDGRLVFKHHIHVRVKDSSGTPVTLPGLQRKVKLARPKTEDFVKVAPGTSIGRSNFTGDALKFSTRGSYLLSVSVSHGASELYAPQEVSLCVFKTDVVLKIEVV